MSPADLFTLLRRAAGADPSAEPSSLPAIREIAVHPQDHRGIVSAIGSGRAQYTPDRGSVEYSPAPPGTTYFQGGRVVEDATVPPGTARFTFDQD